MPYSRPTLTQLRTAALQDLAAAQVTDASGSVLLSVLQKSILRVLVYAEAGMLYEAYAYLDWIAKQAVPFTATDEFLVGWATLKGVTRIAATAATGTATFAGTAGTIPSGSAVTRADGVAFFTTADATISAGSATASIQASATGAAGSFDPGTVFTLTSPISGIGSQSTTSTATLVGTDQETDDSLRSRMLQVYAAPPQGGDRGDYLQWALAVPGVTRAWVMPNGAGAGTVIVYVMLDIARSSGGGFPVGSGGVASTETRDTAATGDQLAVANAILPQQPVTALVYAQAPIATPVAFTIADLGSANTATMQASITAALTDMFLRQANVGGTVRPDTGAVWPALEPSSWYAALEAIPGLTNFKVTVPSAAQTPASGRLLTLGTITFVT